MLVRNRSRILGCILLAQGASSQSPDTRNLGLQQAENPPMQVITRAPPLPAPPEGPFETRPGFTLIHTLDEFRVRSQKDGQKIRLAPGVYRADRCDPPQVFKRTESDRKIPPNRQEHIFAVNGSNNHFDLRGVVIETPLSLQNSLSKATHVCDSWHINGSHNTFEGATFRNVLDLPYPNFTSTESEFEICNDHTTFLDCVFIIQGSVP